MVFACYVGECKQSLRPEHSVQQLCALLGFLGAAVEQHTLIKPRQLSRVCKGNVAAATALDCRRTDAWSNYPVLDGTWTGFVLRGCTSLRGPGVVMILP